MKIKKQLLKSLKNKELEKIHHNLEIYGYHLEKNLIKPQVTSDLLIKVKSYFKKQKSIKFKGLPKRDSKDLRVYNLPQKDKLFIDLLSSYSLEKIFKPKLNDEFYRWLPDDKPNYILNSFNARSSGYKLDLHIDSIIPFTGPKPISYIILFVLEDMYEKNGSTIVVPGSHQSGRFTNREFTNYKIVNAKAGDVLMLDSRTWHGTTENKTSESRWLINAVFSCWWFKQQIDFPKSIPNKIYNKLDNKQKLLLGYCSVPPKSETERINIKCGYEILK